MVLIWAVRGFRTGESPTDPMLDRTKAWLADLATNNATVLVPAPVIGEYLAGVDPAQQSAAAAQLSKQFPVAAYGLVAAVRFAELWHVAYGSGRPGADGRRHKVDMQIVACALASRADALYSHNDDVRKFAAGRIPVREVPPPKPAAQPLPGL